MGLFNWFSKKQSADKSSKPLFSPKAVDNSPVQLPPLPVKTDKIPKPEHIYPLGEYSPMIAFDHNGTMVIMDRDAYDYTYGPVVGTNPAQRDLDELIPQITRVCLLEGSLYQGNAMTSKVVASITSQSAFQALGDALQIVEDPATFDHCHCLGGPTLECYADHQLLATISLQHGKAIRWKHWHADAQLKDGSKISRWLLGQGIKEDQLDALYIRGNSHFMGEAIDPEYWNGLRELGAQAKDLHQAGRLHEVVEPVSQYVARYPDRCEPYSLRADIFDALGRIPEMFADADAAIERGMRNGIVFFQHARGQGMQGQWDAAVADCTRSLAYQPDNSDVLDFRAISNALAGHTNEAQADWEQAIRLKPYSFLPYMHRSQFYYKQGHLDGALQDINQAITLCKKHTLTPPDASTPRPDLADLYLQRGDIRYDLFQEAQTLDDFAEAVRCDPNISGKLGELWVRRGELPRALEAFTQMIALQPEDARGYGARATLYLRMNELDKALADLNIAIHLPPDIHAYGQRALVLLQLDRMEEAFHDLNKQLELHPDDVQALVNRSYRYIKRGEYQKALQDRTRAFELAPAHPMIVSLLAWALATLPDDALRDGQRALVLAQEACAATQWKDPNTLESLAAACAETNNFVDAVRYQQQAMRLMPGDAQQLQHQQDRLKLYQAGQAYRETTDVSA